MWDRYPLGVSEFRNSGHNDTQKFTHSVPADGDGQKTRNCGHIKCGAYFRMRVPQNWSRSNKTENWLFNRTIKLWNTIPEPIIQSKNPKEFRQKLELHLFQQQQEDQNKTFLFY
jgi:hypothetical protein